MGKRLIVLGAVAATLCQTRGGQKIIANADFNGPNGSAT